MKHLGMQADRNRGLAELRKAVAVTLGLLPAAPLPGLAREPAYSWPELLFAKATTGPEADIGAGFDSAYGSGSDSDQAVSSAADEAERQRLIALVELARNGDKEAFGQLYDHYLPQVYRFLYFKVGSASLAEDLTGETFFRALRAMSSFTWQGKDFGAWLMTIARNLSTDHFKSSRARLEHVTEDFSDLDDVTEGPEETALRSIRNETLLEALGELSQEQHDCLVMRFLQGLSLAETAAALGRTSGAIKQLQLRAVRNLAKHLQGKL